MSTSWSPSMRRKTILSVWPPRPARPLNETTAMVAPRRSSACQTGSPEISSCRPGRSRAVCAWEASWPDGVRHGSPLSALRFGHGRARHLRATCNFVGDVVLLRCDVRQREPGATRHVGHPRRARARDRSPRVLSPKRRPGAVAQLSGHRADSGGPPSTASDGLVSALEFRKENGKCSASTPRPLDPRRP